MLAAIRKGMNLMTIKKYYPYLIFILIYSMIVGGAVFYINGKPFVILADDEMISMWYARTLNCTTEGYSNPLWTLFMIPCNLLPQNLACLPVTILNGACIIGDLWKPNQTEIKYLLNNYTATKFKGVTVWRKNKDGN